MMVNRCWNALNNMCQHNITNVLYIFTYKLPLYLIYQNMFCYFIVLTLYVVCHFVFSAILFGQSVKESRHKDSYHRNIINKYLKCYMWNGSLFFISKIQTTLEKIFGKSKKKLEISIFYPIFLNLTPPLPPGQFWWLVAYSIQHFVLVSGDC